MRIRKSRYVSLLAVVALVAAMIPGAPATAAVTKTAAVAPPKVGKVKTNPSPQGVRLHVLDLPQNANGIDIYRSTAAGVEGVKLNESPVSGDTYLDATAKPGEKYFYTVKIVASGLRETNDRAIPPIGGVYPQTAATEIETGHHARVQKAVRPAGTLTREQKMGVRTGVVAPAAINVAPLAKIGLAATTIGASGPTTLTALNTVLTPAMSPIFIRNDVIVPAGKTLTIMPGTRIYFDTAASSRGTGTTHGDPTGKVDLIVHGKLVANGTAAAPIVFTSIQAIVASAPPIPVGGDWGVIYCDSRAASTLTYAQIRYGTGGVWTQDTARPYVTACTLENIAVGGAISAAIQMEDVKTDLVTPRPRIVNNSVASDWGGVYFWNEADAGHKGPQSIDPYVAGNTINAQWGISMWAWDWGTDSLPATQTGNCVTKGTIIGNRITGTNYKALTIGSYSRFGYTTAVYTACSRNVVTADSDTAGYFYAYAYGHGRADVRPTFYADRLTAPAYALDAEGYSNTDTRTAGGGVIVRPRATYCVLSSVDGNAAYLYADSENKSADCDAIFYGGTIETNGYQSVYGYAESMYGGASASPSFTNAYVNSHDTWTYDTIYLYAYTAESGLAKTNPRFVGGKCVNLYDDAMTLYSLSTSGPAEARPYLANTQFYGYYGCIYADAYGSNSGDGNGYANASGVLVNSKLEIANNNSSGYPAYYANADASGHLGAATISPSITGCTIIAPADEALEFYAYSDDGPVSTSPSVTSSTIEGYTYGIYAYAERNPDDPMVVGNATASGLISHSTVKGADSEAIDLYAYNYGKGDAVASPRIHSSRIENTHDDGALYLYTSKDGTGSAIVAPIVDYSYIRGTGDYAVEPYAYGPDAVDGGGTSRAAVAGSYKYCTFENPYYDAIEGAAVNFGGTADMYPLMQDCRAITPDDNAYELNARGYGTGAHRTWCAPTVIRGDYSMTGDGFRFVAYKQYVDPWSITVACRDSTSPVLAAPIVRDTNIYATWDYPVYTRARSYGAGTVTNNALVYNTVAKGESAIYNDCRAYFPGGANAINSARVLGVSATRRATIESFSDEGVSNYTSSELGDATDRTQVRYCNIDSEFEGVETDVYSYGTDTTGTVLADVTGCRFGTKWNLSSESVDLYGYGDRTWIAPTVRGNVVVAPQDDGISIRDWADVNATFRPVVTGNTIGVGTDGVGYDGIYFYEGSRVDSVGPGFTVTGNVINAPGYRGVSVNNPERGLIQANKISNPGWNYQAPVTESDIAGVYWYGAETSPTTAAQVRGNMIKGARIGVYADNGWPSVTYNSFGDAYGNRVEPWNLVTQKAVASPGEAKLFARSNWWGAVATTPIAASIYHPSYVGLSEDIVDYGAPLLRCQPRLIGLTKTTSGSTLKFKLTFDRPMDRSITVLRFGKASPYNKYKATGTWNTAGTVWSGKFSPKSALTSGAKYYFSGARDLPGNLMYPKDKYFKP